MYAGLTATKSVCINVLILELLSSITGIAMMSNSRQQSKCWLTIRTSLQDFKTRFSKYICPSGALFAMKKA